MSDTKSLEMGPRRTDVCWVAYDMDDAISLMAALFGPRNSLADIRSASNSFRGSVMSLTEMIGSVLYSQPGTRFRPQTILLRPWLPDQLASRTSDAICPS
jgi:hypothetical protein